jgi:hypothetical protein
LMPIAHRSPHPVFGCWSTTNLLNETPTKYMPPTHGTAAQPWTPTGAVSNEWCKPHGRLASFQSHYTNRIYCRTSLSEYSRSIRCARPPESFTGLRTRTGLAEFAQSLSLTLSVIPDVPPAFDLLPMVAPPLPDDPRMDPKVNPLPTAPISHRTGSKSTPRNHEYKGSQSCLQRITSRPTPACKARHEGIPGTKSLESPITAQHQCKTSSPPLVAGSTDSFVRRRKTLDCTTAFRHMLAG